MSFSSDIRELRGDALSLLETHIMMNSLIFCLVLILVLRLIFLLVLCLVSLMDLTITHMVLVHERTALSLGALVTAPHCGDRTPRRPARFSCRRVSHPFLGLQYRMSKG
jgi:hypothetical protein